MLATLPGPNESLRAVAFALLLAHRIPIRGADIAAAAGVDDVGGARDALAEARWLDRDTVGRVTGAAGLSLDHGTHVLTLAGHGFRTWCACDALGIAGALGADANINTSANFCAPTVLLRSPAHAAAWATEHGDQGAILGLRQAASRGAREWAERARTAVVLGAWVRPVR